MLGCPKFPLPLDEGIERVANIIAKATDNKSAGVGFSEVMSGFIHVGHDVGDFNDAANLARSRSESARFFLTVTSWDTAECKFGTNNVDCATLTHKSGQQQPPPSQPDWNVLLQRAWRDIHHPPRHLPTLQPGPPRTRHYEPDV